MSDCAAALFLFTGSTKKERKLNCISDNSDIDKQPDFSVAQSKVGYRNPPKSTRFAKGKSGNPSGRPKRSVGTSIKEIFDGDQMGKNGKVVSKREAFVIALVNEALRGNQNAFSKFMTLMNCSGLVRVTRIANPTVIEVPERLGTREDFEREFGRNNGAPSANKRSSQ